MSSTLVFADLEVTVTDEAYKRYASLGEAAQVFLDGIREQGYQGAAQIAALPTGHFTEHRRGTIHTGTASEMTTSYTVGLVAAIGTEDGVYVIGITHPLDADINLRPTTHDIRVLRRMSEADAAKFNFTA